MRRTGDYAQSSDILQESFTRYFERYADQPFHAGLLFKIARNAVADFFRAGKRMTPFPQDDMSDGTDPEAAVLARDEYRRVLDAMKRLPEAERDTLALAVTGNLTYRDIAAITGTSEANVKIRVHRARTHLKQLLQEDDDHEG